MVDHQLYPNYITNPQVLDLFQSIPREKFIPSSLQPVAYSDALLEVLPSRYMMPPIILSRLIQALNSQNSDSILVIGDVTGYTSALLSGICGGVVSLIPETIPETHVQHLKETLDTYSPNPVILKQGPLEKGVASYAPYTHLFFEGSIPYFPKNLLEALTTNSSAVAMIWKSPYLAHAILHKKVRSITSEHLLFESALPLLLDFKIPLPFSL